MWSRWGVMVMYPVHLFFQFSAAWRSLLKLASIKQRLYAFVHKLSSQLNAPCVFLHTRTVLRTYFFFFCWWTTQPLYSFPVCMDRPPLGTSDRRKWWLWDSFRCTARISSSNSEVVICAATVSCLFMILRKIEEALVYWIDWANLNLCSMSMYRRLGCT
jgi:hypothetical protein